MIFPEQIKAILFGFIQGVSEFLPISSSGHLVLLQYLFNISSFDLFFILILHLGTLAAIFSYYRKDLLEIMKHFILHPLSVSGSGRLVYLMVIATIPGVLGGFLLSPFIKKSLSQPYWTGIGFILTGLFLFCTFWRLKQEMGGTSEAKKNLTFSRSIDWNSFSFSTAFLIGLAQVGAFFPGMSRSGWTIATALFLGQPHRQAVCFSFLIAIPAILGGLLFELFSVPIQNIPSVSSLSLTFFSSWIFGYLALKWLVRSLQSLSFPFFAFYLWPLGILTIFLLRVK